MTPATGFRPTSPISARKAASERKWNAALIPRARVGKPAREVDLDLALHGGEDYELLFTARPGKRIPAHIAGVALTQIGHITRAR